MASAHRVSVIVPTFDGESLFPHFIDSLRRTLPELPELVILRHRNQLLCESGADRYDAMLKSIAKDYPECSIEWLEGGFNYALMMNHALRQTGPSTEFVCLANDDIIFATHDWLDKMVEVFDQHPECAIAGCRLLYPARPDTEAAALLGDPSRHFGNIQHAGVSIVQGKGTTHIYKGRPYDHEAVLHGREIEATTFALALIRREAVDQISFDLNLDCDFNDIDFCLQAVQQGHTIRYVASSVHFHLETVTRHKYKLFGKPENKRYFMHKWRDRISQSMSLAEFTKMEPFHE